MNVLFAYDHYFKVKDGKVYSDKISYIVLKRYISVFSKITVLARKKEVDNVDCYPIASGENVEFIFMDDIGSFKSFFGKRKKVKNNINNLLKDFDAVIVRLPSEYGLLVANIAIKKNIPCAVEVVGCVWDALWNYGKIQAKIYAPFAFMRMKKVIKCSDNILYVTKYFLQNRYPMSPIATTTNVSNVELTNIDNKDIIEKRLIKINEENKKIVFGTIGTLETKYKGIHLALKALSNILKTHSFEYHILGKGDENYYRKIAIKNGIDKNVFFDGTLPGGEAVFNWLDNIDIYLQPSLQEGLPRATIEALSRGCPTIGSNAGGIPELISDDLICNPKNINDFVSTILILIDNKDKLKDEAIKNFNTAKLYKKEILDQRRNEFWENFKLSINTNRKEI